MTTLYATHPRYVEHDIPDHPERPERVIAAWEQIETSGLAARMTRLNVQPVTDEQILLVHTPEHMDNLNRISRLSDGQMAMFDGDTLALRVTPDVARLSAGGVVQMVDTIVRGDAHNGLAVVRPPGHHALPGRGMGFCILGNIAIAARSAQKQHGVERVLIVDYDVHHGNGTQDMFYDDPSVLFISTHQAPYYPGTGRMDETGAGHGTGYTLNIPLPRGQGDNNYAAVFEQIVWPAARRYQPQMILVSAGFDAHWVDPLAGMQLTLHGYDHLTRTLIQMANELCGGKIAFVMEGGYDLDAIGHGMANIARALLGDTEIRDPLGGGGKTEPDISGLITQIRTLHHLK